MQNFIYACSMELPSTLSYSIQLQVIKADLSVCLVPLLQVLIIQFFPHSDSTFVNVVTSEVLLDASRGFIVSQT